MTNAIRFTPASLLARFVGYTFRDMIKDLAAEHNFTLGDTELDALVLREKEAVMKALSLNLQPTVGANDALVYTESAGYAMAVVTSSAGDRVQLCLDSVGQARHFLGGRVFSAATSLPVPKGKPAPDIYVFGMNAIGKEGSECVAVEDSSSGTRSAVAAGVKYVIGYVGCYEEHEIAEKATMLKGLGCSHIMYDWCEFPSIMAQLEGVTTVLFDYDNTLGLTEVVAFAACCQVVNATLEEKGVLEVEVA